jgi:hypothetical protein
MNVLLVESEGLLSPLPLGDVLRFYGDSEPITETHCALKTEMADRTLQQHLQMVIKPGGYVRVRAIVDGPDLGAFPAVVQQWIKELPPQQSDAQ